MAVLPNTSQLVPSTISRFPKWENLHYRDDCMSCLPYVKLTLCWMLMLDSQVALGVVASLCYKRLSNCTYFTVIVPVINHHMILCSSIRTRPITSFILTAGVSVVMATLIPQHRIRAPEIPQCVIRLAAESCRELCVRTGHSHCSILAVIVRS